MGYARCTKSLKMGDGNVLSVGMSTTLARISNATCEYVERQLHHAYDQVRRFQLLIHVASCLFIFILQPRKRKSRGWGRMSRSSKKRDLKRIQYILRNEGSAGGQKMSKTSIFISCTLWANKALAGCTIPSSCRIVCSGLKKRRKLQNKFYKVNQRLNFSVVGFASARCSVMVNVDDTKGHKKEELKESQTRNQTLKLINFQFSLAFCRVHDIKFKVARLHAVQRNSLAATFNASKHPGT